MQVLGSPASSHEIGSLTQPSPHESRFFGSSSGIYFINTVKKAFQSAGQQGKRDPLPSVESTIGGDEDDNDPIAGNSFDFQVYFSQGIIHANIVAQLGPLPTYPAAQQYAIEYFRSWHPLLPFLSGPVFLRDLEALYNDPTVLDGSWQGSVDRERLCFLVILQCIVGIGASSSLSPSSALASPSKSVLMTLTAALASKHDLLTIQMMLAAQTFCISTMALRSASSLGGLLSKLIYHAGLHRCPYRYPQLSEENRDLRKRILWSAYALDRYICQALGIPVSLTKSEIDVCVPGRSETHDEATDGAMDLDGGNLSKGQPIPREIILSKFVDHADLVGRALELFHVSLHSRNQDPREILFLRSDVDKWFNSLPEVPKLSQNCSASEQQIARFLPFFHVLYEQLVISINRPSLSLPRTAPEFHHGLQVTIQAAKRTIVAMEGQSSLFWPGYLAAVWMSGLIISFACQIGLYSFAQGSQEIDRCLGLLERMSERWRSAQRCHAVLASLLADLQPARRRTAAQAFGEENVLAERSAKQRMVDPDMTDDTLVASSGTTSETSPNSLGTTDAPGNETPVLPAVLNGSSQWDINDFFQDLSWNNLFDNNNMGQDASLQYYSG